MQRKKILLAGAMACVALSICACEKKGPMEKAGENVDEAVNTLKNGGKRTTHDKLRDAAEDVNDSAHDAAKDLKN